MLLGKLRANVPKVAQGFSIDTPKGKVVDLGTEFGLNVEEDGVTEIYVYVGKVLFEGKDRDAELAFEELEAGEAVFVDKKGNLTWIDMPSEPFFGTADLAYRSMEESQRRHSAWVELSEELAADPRNSLYFTFDDHRSWSRILRDDAQSKKERHDGAIVGCKWSEGRWPRQGCSFFCGRKRSRESQTSQTSAIRHFCYLGALEGARERYESYPLQPYHQPERPLVWGLRAGGSMEQDASFFEPREPIP